MTKILTVSLAIRGGTVVNDSWSGPATVLIEGGRIVGIQSPDVALPEKTNRVVDATNMLLLPGAVDPHCHVDTEVGEFRTRDDYASASEAAVWGGTTTLVDFAIPVAGQSPLNAVSDRIARAGGSYCDIALHGCVVDWASDMPAQLQRMMELGVSTVKLFTTYRDVLMASPDTVLRVMRHLAEIGGLAYVHAESNHLVEAAQAERASRNEMSATHHPCTRPEHTEVAAVNEVLSIAESLGTHVYFVHQSTPAAVSAVTAARARGVRAYSETCPHYLTLNEDLYAHEEPERFVCCPPLRSEKSVMGLRKLAMRGEVHTIGSDHNCFDREQKLKNRSDVRAMPNGLPGVELRLPIMYSELVHHGEMATTELVGLLSANPARLNGIYPQKGTIAVGSDADLVIFDPRETRTIRANSLHMQSDYSPYEGRTVVGWPNSVVMGGELVISDGEWQSKRPGKFLKCGPFGAEKLI